MANMMTGRFAAGAAALMASFLSASAFAAEKPFEGFYVGADLGLRADGASAESDYDFANLFAGAADAAATGTRDSDGFDWTGTGAVKLGYGYGVGQRFVLGAEAAFRLDGDSKISSDGYSFPNPNNRADHLRDLKFDTTLDPRRHASIALQPGIRVADDWLLYGSVAYHYLRADVTTATRYDESIVNAAAAVTEVDRTENFHGVGLGVGSRYALTENWSLNVAAEWVCFAGRKVDGPNVISTNDEITFKQQTEIQPSWVDVTMGVDYRF